MLFSLESKLRGEIRGVRRMFEEQREVKVEGEENKIGVGSNRLDLKVS